MSIYHKDKCSEDELKKFRKKVVDFLKSEKLPYKSVRALKCYGGQVRVYTGRTVETIPQRRSKRLIAWKENGEWKGNVEEAKQFGLRGDAIYILDYHPKKEVQYFPVYREDDWEEEKKELSKWLKTQEWVRKEREKLKTN